MTVTINGTTGVTTPGVTNSGNETVTGTVSGASLIPTSSTIPANGLYLPASNTLAWATNSTEGMRLDSSSNLCVGTPTSLAKVTIQAPNATNAIYAYNPTTNAANLAAVFNGSWTGAAPNNTAVQFILLSDSSGYKFYINANGGIGNYSSNNQNLSDKREKTNFAPAKNYLETICAIPVQTFNYIDQNLEEDPGLTLGVVAQDVQAVAPELVTEANWGTKEDPKMRLSIYQTDLQYALMKCIQELKAELDKLKAKVGA